MKNLSFLSLFGVALFTMTLVGCGNKSATDVTNDSVLTEKSLEGEIQEKDEKVDYNDVLVDLASKCTVLEDSIWVTYDETSNIEDIRSSVNNLLNECSSVLRDIESVGDLEGDSSLKDGVIMIIEKEIAYYTKLIDILPYIDKEELTEEENEIYEGIRAELDSLDRELTDANDYLIRVQEEFAENHGYKLEGDVDEEAVNIDEEEGMNEENVAVEEGYAE